jgi:hypothetical protein
MTRPCHEVHGWPVGNESPVHIWKEDASQGITQAIRSDDIAEVLEDAARAAKNLIIQIFSMI